MVEATNVLLGASVILNIFFIFRIRQLLSETEARSSVQSGAGLSREELEQLKQRMSRLKRISK